MDWLTSPETWIALPSIMRFTRPLFSPFGHPFSGRDLILIVGGLFLLWKSTREIHDKLEGEEGSQNVKAGATFGSVIVQIALLDIVHRHPTLKMLALSFLLLIGVTLIADGLGQHISKGYVYFAMGFSVFVESLNLRLARKAAPVHLKESITP